MARQDPWASVPVVERARPADPAQDTGAANVTLSDGRKLVRRPDGSMYEVASSSYTNETPTQLLNQGYEPDANGVYAKTIGSQEIPWAEVPVAQVATPEQQQQNVIGAGLDALDAATVGLPVSGAYGRSLIEQAPFLQDAILGATAASTGQPLSRIRALDQSADQYDRENNAAQRNLGGIAGFTAGMAVPGAAGGSALRTGLVAGGYNALYGLGTGNEAIQDRGDNAAIAGATGFVGGTALAKGAEALSPVVRRLTGIAGASRGTSPAAQRIADFDQVNIDPNLAMVGGPVSQRSAQALAGNVLTSRPIANAASRTREQTLAAVDNVAGAYGTAEGRDSAGRALSQAARGGAERLRTEGGALYEPINALDANPTRIPLTRSAESIQNSLNIFQTPELQQWFTRNASDLAGIQNVLQTADNQVTFGEARQLRTIVGKMLEDPQVFNSQSQRGLRALYGSLSDDIAEGARAIGGEEAASALSRADSFYSAARNRADNTLRQFYQTRGGREVTDAEAYNLLLSAAKTRGNRSSAGTVRQLRDSVTPEEWGDIGAGVIRTLGGEGDQFSVAKFASEYEGLTPEARRALFGGPGREQEFSDLNALARVMRNQQQAGRYYNYSESGNAIGNLGAGGAIVSAGGAALGGNFVPLAGLIAGTAAGNGLAHVLTSPGVARMLAKAPREAIPEAERLAQRNATFRAWWDVNRDAVVRAVAQNDNLQSLPSRAAATEQEEQP